MPGFPLPLRNALAALAIDALEDDVAAEALRWVERGTGTPQAGAAVLLAAHHLVDPDGDALLPVHAPHALAAAAHAARALAARAAYAPQTSARPVGRAVEQAVALWNVGLFFEVHEVLEDVWQCTGGDERQALQGVIQIAVAFHHLAHGNVRGARKLLVEGRERLAAHARALPSLDAAALLEASAYWETALASGSVPTEAPPGLALAR